MSDENNETHKGHVSIDNTAALLDDDDEALSIK